MKLLTALGVAIGATLILLSRFLRIVDSIDAQFYDEWGGDDYEIWRSDLLSDPRKAAAPWN